jgi:curli biogenesis system outer membrane secretion channel CsgG
MGAIGAALIPAGISLVGSLIGGNAASDAANTQANAAQQGINTIQNYNNQSRTDLMPWLMAGQSSLGGLTSLLGLGGNGAQQSAIDNLQSGPLFQSLYRQGTNAILGNASATGGLRGGNTEGALYNLGSDTLNQVIQNQIANLTGLSNTGFQAGGLLGQFGQDTAQSIAQLLGAQGAARAGGQLGSASALTGALGNIGGLFGQGGALSGIFGGSAPLDLTGLVPAFPSSSAPFVDVPAF